MVGTVGPAVEGVDVLLMSPDGNVLSGGETTGELYAAGDNVMKVNFCLLILFFY